MDLKHITYLILLTWLISCSNDAEEKDNQDEMFSEDQASELANLLNSSIDTNNERIVEESIIGDQSKKEFDTTLLLGVWVIHDSDRSVLEHPYVDEMPIFFHIYDVNQIQNGSLKAQFENSNYPFMINKIDKESMILHLHPDVCMCEGLEVRYRKE